MTEQMDAVGEVELPHLRGKGAALRPIPRDHPVEIRPGAPRGVRRANQSTLILRGLQDGNVCDHARPRYEAERRADAERRCRCAAHLLRVDAVVNDHDLAWRKPCRDQRGPDSRRDGDHQIHLVQRAPRAYGEHDPAARDDAGRGPCETQETPGPDRQRDRVAVVRVDDIGGPDQGFDDQPPPGPRVEPESPRDLANGAALRRGPARELTAAPRDEPLLDTGLPSQLAGQQPDLVLTAPEFPAGVDVEDAHAPQAGCFAAWPSAARSSASVNGLWR